MSIKKHYEATDDPVLPNYLALFACILHKDMSVSKALTLMEIKSDNHSGGADDGYKDVCN